MADDGWGRPRPKFADLSPSTPSPDHSKNDGHEPMDDAPTEDQRQSRVQRAIPLIDFPIFDGVPIAELSEVYVREKRLTQDQVPAMKKFYTTWSNGEKSPKTKYFCVFTCPATGERFGCGHWKNEKGVTVVGEKGHDAAYWYNTKKHATIAAAARALDCFSLRRCEGTGKDPFRRCEDPPYPAGNAPRLPDLPSGVALPTPLPRGSGRAARVASPPKKALCDWYLSLVKKLDNIGIVVEEQANESGPRSECYDCWSDDNLNSPDKAFTAIFTCHLTGERFASGSVIGDEDNYKKGFWYYDQRERILVPRGEVNIGEDGADDSSEVEECLGLQRIYFVWYKTKKKAIAAAAARAVDCFRHRDSPYNDISDDQRYCQEKPYSVGNAPELWKNVSETVRRVGSIEWASLPHNDRLTTWFGVPDLHGLLEGERSDEYWRAKYRERRQQKN